MPPRLPALVLALLASVLPSPCPIRWSFVCSDGKEGKVHTWEEFTHLPHTLPTYPTLYPTCLPRACHLPLLVVVVDGVRACLLTAPALPASRLPPPTPTA